MKTFSGTPGPLPAALTAITLAAGMAFTATASAATLTYAVTGMGSSWHTRIFRLRTPPSAWAPIP